MTSLRCILVLSLVVEALHGSKLNVTQIGELVWQGRYVQLRETAEKALCADENSAEGWFALGVALLEGEGVLPRAHFCLSRARKLIEKTSSGDDRSLLYALTLESLAQVAQLMDRYEEQVALYELHDRLFEAAYDVDIGWPLMKLGRLDEARRRMRTIMASGSEDAASTAMNTLGVIEFEQGDVELGYTWFKSSLQKRSSTAVSHNLAEAALVMLRFEEAERILLAVAESDGGSFPTHWTILSQIYALEGRLPEALNAARKMMAWNASGKPWAADQKASMLGRVAAQLLLATGRDEDALRLTGLLLNRSERHGVDSGRRWRSEVALLAVRHEALRVHRERLAEEAASAGWAERAALLCRRVSATCEMWRLRCRSGALLAANCGFEASVVPYGLNAPLPEWLRPPAGESFGQATEWGLRKRCSRPVEQPYHVLRIGEIELARGHPEVALASFQQAADRLPEAEVLLRARLRALQGKALEMTGRPGAAAVHYQAALEKDARVFRALSFALPVTVLPDSHPASRTAADMFRRSPRFRPGSLFRLHVLADGNFLTARLESPVGTVLARARSAAGPRALYRELHEAAFVSRADLSQVDWRSLDGSNEPTRTLTPW